MSYILDALKRADAERQHGTVPSLHARQVTTPAVQKTSGAQNRRWLAAGAVLMLAAAAAAGGWFWRAPSGGAPRQADAQIAMASPAAVANLPPVPALAPPTPTPLPVPVPVTAAPIPQKSEPAPKPEAPPRRVVAPKPAPPPPAAVAPAAPKSQAETTTTKTIPASASAPAQPAPAPEPAPKTAPSRAAPAELPLLSELPENIRRQIPAMAINGVVYSENPGQRVLLVNQQVLTPGSQAVPDVKLEEIRPHSSVFSFQGTRFRLAH
ncbi:general secretion pathway protein B [Polaromonas sp. CG_9.5]|uniref:general secretion pathway protein GspB n=1 Tax=Polaromonas sp. CG_9.5 TaxID=3071705 RepID=UPI002E0215C8|nr:general secretion pathway protein B [Polaromonas sp. CG_9.5]